MNALPGDLAIVDAVACVVVSKDKEVSDEKFFVITARSLFSLTLKYYVVRKVYES
jgi:hypothetical protein